MSFRIHLPYFLSLVALLVTVIIQASNLYSAYDLPILRDEAYYWLWSKYPAAGYFDHPPMIAWVLAAFTWLFGDSHFSIRITGVVSWLIGLVLMYRITVWCFASRRAGVIALAFVLMSPVFQIPFNVVTPDTLLFVFVILYLLALGRAIDKNRLIDWILLGLAIGGLFLSKYTGIVMPFVLTCYLFATAYGRTYLLSPGPWVAALTSIILVLPLIWWNAEHDWVSFGFQLRHGLDLGLAGEQNRLDNLFSYSAGQMIIFFLPFFFLITFYGIFWCRKSLGTAKNAQYFVLDNCIWIFLFTMLLFGLIYTFKSGELNWTAFACVPALIVLAGTVDYLMKKRSNRFWLSWMFLLSAVLSLILLTMGRYPLFIESLFSVKIPRTQVTNSYGWQSMGNELKQSLSRNDDYRHGKCAILAGDYSTASWLAWNLGSADRVQTYDDPEASRKSQFDIWRREMLWGQNPCFFIDLQRDSAKVRQTVGINGQQWRKLEDFTSHNPDGTISYFSLYSEP